MRDGAVYTTFRRTFGVPPDLVKIVLASLALVVVFKNVRHVTGMDDVVIPIVTLKCVFLSLFVMVMGTGRLPRIVRLVVTGTFN